MRAHVCMYVRMCNRIYTSNATCNSCASMLAPQESRSGTKRDAFSCSAANKSAGFKNCIHVTVIDKGLERCPTRGLALYAITHKRLLRNCQRYYKTGNESCRSLGSLSTTFINVYSVGTTRPY